MSEFVGRVAVITGGGRGFGKAFGHALALRGAHVVLLELDHQAGLAAAAEIRAAGYSAEALEGDVADEDRMVAVMADVAARRGGIDFLINNAGIHSAEANKPIGALGIKAARRMFDVNVWGVINCTLAARPHMAGRAGAAMVNISSMAAYGATMAYGVTKLTVQGLTMSFAHELAGEAIRVNAIAPGLIFTDTIRAELDPGLIDYVMKTQILQREGEERDIVEAMLHLVSDRSSFMTGETIRVSGGATLQI
jgi:3-oxoacyl-[acyl-carrier protein] reductase